MTNQITKLTSLIIISNQYQVDIITLLMYENNDYGMISIDGCTVFKQIQCTKGTLLNAIKDENIFLQTT